jgi:class 3 adenylate cyclase
MDEILAGKTVLVVDDTAVSRMLAADVLVRAGVRLLEADSGEIALQAAREHAIDAFLLDVRMGDMNGIELCRALRAMDRYRGTPIVFVTAMDEREVLQWALEAGADDYIQKPLHAMVLRRRLANLVQKATALRQAELVNLSLQRYVSPRTEEIARAYAATGLLPAPERQEVCVLFADARSFTELNRELGPEVVFELLAGHLAAQAGAVYRHGGYVDKYSADGLMAVFDGRNRVPQCCACALDLLDSARELRGGATIQARIGIHQGAAMIGNLGSAEHLDYTVVGEPVNLAARLCGLARDAIVVSQAVRDALRDAPGFAFANERSATIRGFSEPVGVCDLLRPGPAS